MTAITRIIDIPLRAEDGRSAGIIRQTDYANRPSTFDAMAPDGYITAAGFRTFYLAQARVLRDHHLRTPLSAD